MASADGNGHHPELRHTLAGEIERPTHQPGAGQAVAAPGNAGAAIGHDLVGAATVQLPAGERVEIALDKPAAVG